MPLPLLAKDLTERAAHRRTYVVRCVFGLLLSTWFWLFMHRRGLGNTGSGFSSHAIGSAIAGTGRSLFHQLSHWVCWALLIVQPALMAPALTLEKERGTLELLLLTPMRLWSLLMQKFCAGLLPMAN